MGRLPGVVALFSSLQAGFATAAAQGDGWLPTGTRIPLWLKVLYTLFLCVLVPVYWRQYGPANFLWFSDIALIVTLAALWLESRFLAGTQAVAVTALELLWVVDFLVRLTAGVHVTGISRYMFKPEIPWLVRGLSLFHVWLPFLLLWLVWRLGYDRRAWLAQSALALVVLPLCYFFTDPSENVNWVFGPGEKPQGRMPPGLYLALLMAFFPLCVYLPTHLVLQWAFAEHGAGPAGVGAPRSP
jgi:hypothetical protein